MTRKLLTFVCHWCSHGAADQAGALKLSQPPGVRLVRVMCSGRVEPSLILEGFRAGADGVLVVGCHPGDCHYKEGNYRARNRVALTRSLLGQLGIEPDRLRLDWAGAAEGGRFQQIVESMYTELTARPALELPGAEPPLPSTPKLLTFVCHWCSHGAADQAGAMKLEQPAGVRLVRVMCSGRVDAALILEGFRSGADGVLVMGCHPGDCHYKEGNYKARNRVTLTRSLLTQFGIEPERLRIDWAGAAEGARFQQIVESTYADLLARGPLARPVGALPEVAP